MTHFSPAASILARCDAFHTLRPDGRPAAGDDGAPARRYHRGMIRILLRALIFLLSAALGLWVASLLLPDLTVTPSGFITAVVVFAVTQSVLSPFLAKVIARGAPAFLGGIGLVSTFVALWIASLFPGGLTIVGWQTWILAALVVWLVTALATLLLPLLLLREAKNKRTGAAGRTP